MTMLRKAMGAALMALAVFPVVACSPKEERYESVCQLIRRSIVETDSKGKPELIDLELEWDPCPGDQFQVVRGGREFAECMAKYEIGDYLPVHVLHQWDTRGYYKWDLYRVGDCERPIERGAEGSYEKSQECTDRKSFGRTTGFTCSRKPFRELVKVCPWMSRE
ncbi:hypothetical protein [Pendulispora albinea]|uniref:Lipoprotein n=1 Tax=Pendulispora albinea TaxID=2741071 RepID=A0ABZ2LTN1_9BACT